MESLRHPTGPLPPSVYWRRRVVVLAVPLVVIGAIAYGCAAGGSSPTKQAASGSPTPGHSSPGGGPRPGGQHSPPATPITPAPGPSGPVLPGVGGPAPSTGANSGGTGGGSAGGEAPASADCRLRVLATLDRASYPTGVDPRITVTVTDVGSDNCTFGTGSPSPTVTITSAGVRVWSSSDCATAGGGHTLTPGGEYTMTVIWQRRHSAPGCAPDQPAAQPGTYSAAASAAGVASPAVLFRLT